MESPISNLQAQLYTTKISHYDGKIKTIWANIDPHRLSGWFLTKLWTQTWYIFMDCVTTRLQIKWACFFQSLTLKNARKLGKLAKFILVVREPRKNLGNMTKKVVRNSEIFSRKLTKFLLMVCDSRKYLGKMTKKMVRNSEIFQRKCRNLFWWSAARDKICQVVRESEEVENRWFMW